MPRNVSYAKHAAEVLVSEKEKESFYICISFLGLPLGLKLAPGPSSVAIRVAQVGEP